MILVDEMDRTLKPGFRITATSTLKSLLTTALAVGVGSRQGEFFQNPFRHAASVPHCFFDFVPMHPLEEFKPTFVKVQQR